MEVEDNELDEYIIQSINKITENNPNELTKTNGSVYKELKPSNKHKRSPQNQETDMTDKRKKIIPDQYDEAIDYIVETGSEEAVSQQELARTPSMRKILTKIPDSIKFTKVNTNECGGNMQS